MRPSIALLSTIIAVLVVARCDDDLTDVLDEPRILAIRSTPPALNPGGQNTLEALTFDVEQPLSWRGCAVNWTAVVDPTCPAGAIDFGRGNPVTIDVPADLARVYIRADSEFTLPTVRLLESDVPATENPSLQGIVTGDGSDAPTAMPPESQASLRPVFGPTVDEANTVVSWLTTGGQLDPERTVGEQTMTLTAPAETGEITLYAVARTKDGGVQWLTHTLTVRAP